LFLTLRKFEKQLQLFRKFFKLVSLEDVYKEQFDPEAFSVCLTFDDGFANNYKYVLPLLERYEVPATFFVTSISETGYNFLWNDALSIAGKMGPASFIFKNEQFTKARNGQYLSASSKQSLNDLLRNTTFAHKAELTDLLHSITSFTKKIDPDYWLQMSKEQIKSLATSKWATIGSHSAYHNDLAKETVDELKQDLQRSKHFLESVTGKEVKALAFPYGSYTEEVVRQAKNAGFSQLLATEFLYKENYKDQVLKERQTINPFISPINQLYATIAGNYE
jgi:peptidoglycan/xylan/chitin deacetylase (PgdA/CDA1 family)